MTAKRITLQFTNSNGIPGKVKVEAPVGALAAEFEIPGKETKVVDLGVVGTTTLRIVARAAGHDDYPDHLEVELGGKPMPVLLTSVVVNWTIGSLHGSASAEF